MSSRLDVISNAEWLPLARKAGFRVRALAQSLSVSSEGLRIYMKLRFNATPKDWLVALRLRDAPRLLGERQFVREVAKASKYRYPTHFSRAFRKVYGCSPRAFATAENRKPHP